MKNNAFTLIEIIVVLIILGVLATLALSNLFSHIQRSKAAEAIVQIGQISKELQACYAKSGDISNCPVNVSSKFFNISTSAAGLPVCVRIAAQWLDSTAPTANITCTCQGNVTTVGLFPSPLAKILDLSTNTLSDCSVSSGYFQGM